MNNHPERIIHIENHIRGYCNKNSLNVEDYGARLGYIRTTWHNKRKKGSYTVEDLVVMAKDFALSLEMLLGSDHINPAPPQ